MSSFLKRTLLCLAFLAALPGAADEMPQQDVRIVFDLEHSILQAVPSYNAKNIDASRLIQVDGKYFAIAPDTQKAIERLVRDFHAKIVIADTFPAEKTRKILDAILLDPQAKTTLGSVVEKVISATDDPAVPEDLIRSGCPDPRHCILVMGDEADSLKDDSGKSALLLRSGPDYFEFESFAAAQAGAEETRRRSQRRWERYEDSFPSSEKKWESHQKRVSFIYGSLLEALKSGSLPKSSPEEIRKRGAAQLAAKLEWKRADGRVTGCQEGEVDLPLAVCKGELEVRYAWTGKPKNHCTVLVQDPEAVLGDASVDECIARLGARYLWTERELSRCGIFTREGVFIRDGPKEKCTLNLVCDPQTGVLSSFTKNLANEVVFKILKDFKEADRETCDEAFEPVSAEDSPNLNYFQDLLKRGLAAPIADFMKLWYPDRKSSADPDAFMKKYEAGPDLGFKFDKDCQIDTLYSWGPPGKVTNLQNTLPDGAVWAGPPNPGYGMLGGKVWSTYSALGTFGYGKVPIRFRLKRGSLGNLVSEPATTSLQDYVISDASAIESWSFGTPEHYDEIVRDYLRSQSGSSWVGYDAEGVVNLYAQNWDGHEFSENSLKANLLEMIRMIVNKEGRIYYSKGACRSRAREFMTAQPTYINPFPAPPQ